MAEVISLHLEILLNYVALPVLATLVTHQIAEKLLNGPLKVEELSSSTEINPIDYSDISESLQIQPMNQYTQINNFNESDIKSNLVNKPNAFIEISQDPHLLQVFQTLMTEQTKLFMPELLKNIDIGDAKNVLDLGGADGSLAIELAKKYPDIKLTVFDRAEIKPLCEHHISLNHLVERVRFIEGNFLERVPLEYDCIIMKHILHDWTDEAVVAILSNCRNSLRTGDKLHIIDFCVDSNSQFYTSSLAIDAFMMMVHNGQERSLKQFEKVLGLARFKIVCVTPVGHEADIQAEAID